MTKYILLLSLFSSIVWAAPEVTVPSEIEISQKRALYVGDIVEVKNGSLELIQALEDMKIREDARDLLISQKLSPSEVTAAFRKSLSSLKQNSGDRPIIKVPTEIKIHFSKSAISTEEVKRKLQNRLYSQCPECEFKVMVQSTPVPQSEEWQINYDHAELKGGVLLPLVDGNNRSAKYISANIRVSKLTPVAKRFVKQGERVTAEDFEFKFSDVTHAKDAPVDTMATEDLIAVKNIIAGNIAWSGDFRKQAAAQRGQVVKAILGDESFEISTDMVAEENGYVGDTIRLKSVENKKLFSGTVISKGVVRIK